MRRLDRYIFRETLYPALIALVVLTFLWFSKGNGLLLEIIFRQLATASEIWTISSALLPTLLSVTIPMALLVGILTGFGRMSADSEIIALRASGVSILRILRPVLVLAFLAWALTMAMTVWVAPRSLSQFNALRHKLETKAVSLALQSRVFNELGEDKVLYLDEITAEDGLQWRKILLAEGSPDQPNVTFAESGALVPDEAKRRYQVTLKNTSKLEVVPLSPGKEQFSTIEQLEFVLPMRNSGGPGDRPVFEVATADLWQRIRSGVATRQEHVDFHHRLALPFACLAFALLGLPLGVSTSRGGKSLGLVISLILMFTYYLSLIGGSRLAGENSLSPLLGAWIPNIVFAALGLVLLARSDREYENRALALMARAIEWAGNRIASVKFRRVNASRSYALSHHSKLFRLLDIYVLRGFFFYFAIVLSVFASLFIVVTLFELLRDIVRNNIPTQTVVTYFVFFLPQIIYWVLPLAVLLAILINLGTLTKTNEVLAVKAGAVSLYRLSLPLLMMGALLSGVIYIMQDFILPRANKIQDEYHNIIKGKQSQTYRNPGQKWMKGSDNSFYYYAFFDHDENVFKDVSMLKVDPQTFTLREWTFAKRGTWEGEAWTLENGWTRQVSAEQNLIYRPFQKLEHVEMDSPDYFKKEVREADQMNYMELKAYVEDLRQSGFDVTRLTLDLYRKLSFPLVTFIMALIGVPFSFKTGRKGAFYGIGLCVAVGILYWSTFEVFGKLGGINRLEPLIAAWFPNLIFGAGGLWMMLRVKT